MSLEIKTEWDPVLTAQQRVEAGKGVDCATAEGLLEEIERYRALSARAKYRTILVTIDTERDDTINVHCVASSEADDRTVSRAIRRQIMLLIRQSQRTQEREEDLFDRLARGGGGELALKDGVKLYLDAQGFIYGELAQLENGQ